MPFSSHFILFHSLTQRALQVKINTSKLVNFIDIFHLCIKCNALTSPTKSFRYQGNQQIKATHTRQTQKEQK